MENIKIVNQFIRLKNKPETTPSRAINEAINFCIEHKISECELDYEGFLFDIEPDSDLKEKVSEYYRCKNSKNKLH